MSDNASRALVLLSGGLDSTACVHFYSSRGFIVETMFIDYGQLASKEESRAAAAVSSHYKTKHNNLRIDGSIAKKPGVIRGRNAFFLFSGLCEWQSSDIGLIAMGIHAGTNYPDCSFQFISAVQNIFNVYSSGCIIAAAPFVDWSKRDIWEYCRANKIPTELTYSCQVGGATPCGKCESCLDRSSLNAL